MSDGETDRPGAGPRRVRIADADRERAAQLLQQALTEGRISVAELDERMRQIYAALFADELEQPFHDLPASPSVALPVAATPAAVISCQGGAAVAPAGPHEDAVLLSTGWGTVKRDGRWAVPARLNIEVGAGTVVLDCTAAVFAQPVIAIDVRVKSGTCKVILPEGPTADIDGVRVKSGSARNKVGSLPDPSHAHLVITGTVGSGSLVVRHPFFG